MFCRFNQNTEEPVQCMAVHTTVFEVFIVDII